MRREEGIPMGTHRVDEVRPINRKILLGIVIGVTVTATVTAMAATNHPSVEQETVEMGAASTLDPAFKLDQKLTPQQARDRAKDDAAAARTVATLRRSLGNTYAGAWIDSNRKLVVGLIDRTRMDEVKAAGAEPRLMKNNITGLAGTKTRIDRFGGSAPSAVVSWYVDPPTNSVVIQAKKDPAAEGFIERVRGTGDMVRVEWTDRRPQVFADLVGGNGFTVGDARCSIGFSATGPNGTKHILTAGHCTRDGGVVLANGLEMGRVGAGTFDTDGDFGLVDVTDPDAQTTAFVDTRDGGPITVTGSEPAPLGASVCRSGSTSGFACGEITALDETVNYGNGSIVRGLTRTSVCAEPGDSGGPFVSGTQAQGLTSGGVGDCATGGTTFFQPVNEALSAYGLTLVTS
jgi:streptogrisin C